MSDKRNISSRFATGTNAGSADRIDWDHLRITPGTEQDNVRTTQEMPAPEQAPTLEKPALQGTDSVSDIGSQLMLDNSLPLFVASPNGALLHANELYRELAKRTEDLPEFVPNSANVRLPNDVRQGIEEVIAREDGTLNDRTLTVDGEDRQVRFRYFPVRDGNSNIVAIGAYLTDITSQVGRLRQLSAGQRRFQDFARSSSDWFWEVDREFRVLVLSERFTSVAGHPAAAFLGRRLDDVGEIAENLDGQAPMAEAVKRRAPFRDQLLNFVTADEEILQFHLSGVPIFDTNGGEFKGYRGAGEDVTEKYLRERESREIRANLESTLSELTHKNLQLDIASAQAESALRAKNEFLASMSHELKTPLNAIIGFSEAMQMQVFGELNEKYVEYSKDIVGAGRHLLGLINDILEGAVVDSGGIDLKFEDTPLDNVIKQATNMVRIRAEEKQVDIASTSVETGHLINVEPRRATQIFANLLTNAIKFTPEQGKIGIEISPHGKDQVAVTVWDTGIGIPKDQQEKIFEKFQQVTDTIYTRAMEGTGLGLHISRELARRMGGDISVSSKPGEGSRFTVVLSLVTPEEGRA